MVALSKTDDLSSPARRRAGGGRASNPKRAPQRQCALHRIERPTEELIRFVVAPEGHLVPDLKQNLPGRGVWVSADRASVSEAAGRNAFARSLKQSVSVSPDLADEVERLLLRRVLATLSMANKAGAVVHGFTKTVRALEKSGLLVLLNGADGAADGRNKLVGKYLATGDRAALARRIVAILTIEQLSLAIGRPNVVHAGITEKGIADTFLSEAQRLERFGQSKTTGEITNSQTPIGNE